MLLELATLKNFDPGTYKAGVQLADSLTTYFDDVPVSRAIPISSLVIGNRVILAIPGDNPKDAVVIATWPQGSPGGAEVHGNEYHDPDFATQADFLAHASRHIWPGADVGNFMRTPIARQVDDILYVDWQSRAAWTDYFTGSASRLLDAILEQQLGTGTTIDSIAAMYTQPFATLSPHSAQRVTAFRVRPRSDPNNSDWWFIATKQAQPTFPLTTHPHIGFRILNGNIWATNGNGTSGTQTDLGLSLTSSQWAALVMLAVNGSVQFYVQRSIDTDLTLRATHSTNMPTEWSFAFWIGGKNTTTANKPYSIHSLGMSK
jgi:hypothetical protein